MSGVMVHHSNSQASYNFIEEIDFRKYWLVLKRRWFSAFILSFAVCGGVSLTVLLMPDVYQAEGKVQFKSDLTPRLTGLTEELGEVEKPLTMAGDPLETQVEVVMSSSVLQNVVQTLQLRDDDGELLKVDRLQRQLTVEPVSGTEILQISYESSDPSEAAAVVNQVIESYSQANIAANRDDVTTAVKFLDAQLPQSESEVRKLEESLRRYKERHQIVALETEAGSTVGVLSSVVQNLTQVKSQLADVDAQLAEAKRQLDMGLDESLDVARLQESAGVQNAVVQLQTIQDDIAKESAVYQDSHPVMLGLRNKEANLKQVLEERIQQVTKQATPADIGNLQSGGLKQELVADYARLAKQRTGLTNQIVELSQAKQKVERRAALLPSLEQGQRELERRLAAAQATYETLLAQREKVRTAEAQVVGNVKILSVAEVPEEASGPNRKLFLVAGVLVGALLGIATAFLLDLLDGSFKSVREVEELLDYPILGTIPKVPPVQQQHFSQLMLDQGYGQLIDNHMEQMLLDSYQMLQANLNALQLAREVRTLAISSAVYREGKSQVATNLAVVLAQMGRRVLSIDADMRRPRQSEAVIPQMGLSHVLLGEVPAQSAIQRSQVPNLDILTAGEMPTNSAVLLNSQAMKRLLQRCMETYDLIILDTPPLLTCADTAILGQIVDGMLLVVRPGGVNYAQGNAMKDFAERFSHQILGVVVNGVDWRNDPNTYYHTAHWRDISLAV